MTRRLIVGLTAALTLFWLLAAGISISVMKEEYDEVFDSAVQETAERLVPIVVDDLFQHEAIETPRRVDPLNATSGEEYLTYQVRDAAGKVLIHSHDVSVEPFDVPLKQGFFETDTARVYTAPAVSNTIFVQVADQRAHRIEALTESGIALLLPLVALVPVSGLVVWLIVRASLAPVNDLRREISAKDSGNLAAIPFNKLPSELQTIGRSVNLLLARLRAALDAEREFTANSAHELRTPLAGALAQTQLLVSGLAEGPERVRARQVEASLRTLGRLVEKLMQLARAESGIAATGKPVDLTRVIDLVVEDFCRAAARPELVRYSRPEGVMLMQPISEDAFAIVLRNLIENAVLHGDRNQPVEIRLDADGTLHIVNDAETVPDLLSLRQRFARGKTMAPGSGLGLSIADRLVSQMPARLDLFSPAQGRDSGFEAVIRFETVVTG